MGLFGPPNVEKLKTKRDVDGLLRALQYKRHGDVREAAAKALGAIGDERAVEPLCTAFNDSYDYARIAAADALVRIGKPAVEPLCAVLKDKDMDETVRTAAALVLGRIGDRCAVEPLCAALKDSKKYVVRWEAARALGVIGDERAVVPLCTALGDEAGDVRKAATEALDKIGIPQDPALQAWRAVVKGEWQKAVDLGAVAVEPLCVALKDSDCNVRKAAAEALDGIGVPRDPAIQAWHAAAKGEWQKAVDLGSVAVEPLCVALKNRDVAKAAAEALGEIGDERAVKPLCAALDASHPYVRAAAAKALVRIGKPAVEPLCAVLKEPGRFSGPRRAAAKALVTLYRNGGLDESSKQRILAVREIMANPHTDVETGSFNDCAHSDVGIGVRLEEA